MWSLTFQECISPILATKLMELFYVSWVEPAGAIITLYQVNNASNKYNDWFLIHVFDHFWKQNTIYL